MSEEVMIPKSYHDKVCENIIRFKDKQFYDAVHLLDDGTLEITVEDYTKVKRVLVEDDNNWGNLFYEDGADRPQGEWIEYDDAIERLGAYLMADAQIEWGGTASEDIEDWKELATDILKGSPNIEIVRCKECRYCKKKRGTFKGEPIIFYRCTENNRDVEANDFCSYGEREGE